MHRKIKFEQQAWARCFKRKILKCRNILHPKHISEADE